MRQILEKLPHEQYPLLPLQLREAMQIYDAVVWRQALLAQTTWAELVGLLLLDDLTIWPNPGMKIAGGGGRIFCAIYQASALPLIYLDRQKLVAAVGLTGTICQTIFAALIAFFESAQFQTLVRTALKIGGLWIYNHAVPASDQSAAAQLEFVNHVIGGGLMAWGIILSSIVHTGYGHASTGTSGGVIANR